MLVELVGQFEPVAQERGVGRQPGLGGLGLHPTPALDQPQVFLLPLFLAFFLFIVAGFAETNRAPFDMPEAESELVAGYHSEYSAFKFSMFFIAEYANIMTFCAMTSVLFLGGWDIPFTTWDQQPGVLQTVATALVMALKTSFLIFVVMWVRWTLPRFRYDQLMALGWKVMIPVALAYIIVVTSALYVFQHVLGLSGRTVMWALTGVSAVCAFIVFVLMDRGTLISGTAARAGARASARPASLRGGA